jgi:hypothetical protein
LAALSLAFVSAPVHGQDRFFRPLASGAAGVERVGTKMLTPVARAMGLDEDEDRCDDADIEDLDTRIQCNGGNWLVSGEYDVEVENPTGSDYDLILTVTDCNRIPADNCGRLASYTIPLTPTALDADDDEEIEFVGAFSECLPGDVVVHCDRLRVHAEVVARCDRVVLDEEEDRIDVLEKGQCTRVAEACPTPCDPCAPVVTRTTPCDPCGDARVTTVRYEDSGYRRTYITDDDADDVEIEYDDDGEVEVDD